MKSIMLSIQPKYCELIANGKKTIEIRKTAPKLQTPFKCYIYCTKGKEHLITVFHKGEKVFCDDANSSIFDKTIIVKSPTYFLNNPFWRQKVIGEFVCDKIEKFTVGSLRCDDIETLACLSYADMINYFYKPEELDGKTAKFGYGLHITDLKIYDKPKELSEFRKPCPFPSEDCDLLCPHALGEYHGDGINGDVEFVGCGNMLTRPPQSWCYVEEI